MVEEFPFHSRRSPVLGTRGMVATSQPAAVSAGLEILAQGGNAADAAVAAAAALNVTEPTSTGIGGDCFALYFDAQLGRVTALNGSGRAPAGLTLGRLKLEGLGEELPPFHPYTVTVPGACAGWCDLIERHGSQSLEDILSTPIRLAEEGFPVAPITAYHWKRGAKRLAAVPNGHELTIQGRAPYPGEIFRNPGLARTFQVVAEHGKKAFYEGEIAEAIAAVIQEAGGCMSVEDLAAHHSTWDNPISISYRGYRMWECPPNGQGLAALLALNILEGFDIASIAPLSPRRFHLEIEAMRLAFADARWFVADSSTDPAPVEALLSKSYAGERRTLIDPERAILDRTYGVSLTSSDTVYLSVVDGSGNACSFINSNYMGFGTGIVPKGWGFTLQNRGHNFSLDERHPNVLAPRKRPYHTIIPGLITRGEVENGDLSNQASKLFACYGVMGGFMQPQGHTQVAVALIDDGLDPQAALDRPRFCIKEGTAAGSVALEEGIPPSTIEGLARRGHLVIPTSGHARAIFGRGQVIVRDPQSGVLWGGSDPRADGCAMSL